MTSVQNIDKFLFANGVVRRVKRTLFFAIDTTGAAHFTPVAGQGDAAETVIPQGCTIDRATLEPENGTDTITVTSAGTGGVSFCLSDGTRNFSVLKPFNGDAAYSAAALGAWSGCGLARVGADGAPVVHTADILGTAIRLGCCSSAGALVTDGSYKGGGSATSRYKLTLWIGYPMEPTP